MKRCVESWNRKEVDKKCGSESIKIVWTHIEYSYGWRGVDDRSKRKMGVE